VRCSSPKRALEKKGCSGVDFRSSKKLFTQARRYFCPSEDILAQAKIVLEVECSLEHFRSSDRIFAQGKRILAQAIFFYFFFSLFFSFLFNNILWFEIILCLSIKVE